MERRSRRGRTDGAWPPFWAFDRVLADRRARQRDVGQWEVLLGNVMIVVTAVAFVAAVWFLVRIAGVPGEGDRSR